MTVFPAIPAHPPPALAALRADTATMGFAMASTDATGAMLRVRTAAGTAHLPLQLDARLPLGTAMVEGGHAATAPLPAGRGTVEAA